jgi:PPOX class probable F420-dependent enzyme
MTRGAEARLPRLDDAGVDAFLAEPRRSGHLASVTPGGLPQVAPLWFGWDRPRLWLVSFRDSRRARNIAATPRVALSVDSDRFPARGALLQGSAELLAPEREPLARILERYLPQPDDYLERYLADPNRVLIRVDVDRVSGWDAAA